MVVGQHMQIARRPLLAHFQIGKPVVEHGVDIATLGLGALTQRPVEQRTGGTLPAFVEPPARKHCAEVVPHTPGTMTGSALTAMRQFDVPPMIARLPGSVLTSAKPPA